MIAIFVLGLLVYVELRSRADHRQYMAAAAHAAAERAAKEDAECVGRLREAWLLGYVRRDDETEEDFLRRFDARHIPGCEVSRDVR